MLPAISARVNGKQLQALFLHTREKVDRNVGGRRHKVIKSIRHKEIKIRKKK